MLRLHKTFDTFKRRKYTKAGGEEVGRTLAWRLMLFATEEVFVIEARESECSGQHVEEVVVARQLDDDHEQDLK